MAFACIFVTGCRYIFLRTPRIVRKLGDFRPHNVRHAATSNGGCDQQRQGLGSVTVGGLEFHSQHARKFPLFSARQKTGIS